MNAAILVSPSDNVATALEPLAPGRQLPIAGRELLVLDPVPAGHKIAIQAIARGAPILKYGNVIGLATTDISAGAHVHTHNVASTRGRGDLAPVQDGHAWSRE